MWLLIVLGIWLMCLCGALREMGANVLMGLRQELDDAARENQILSGKMRAMEDAASAAVTALDS